MTDKEVFLAKALNHEKNVDNVVIRIEEELPNILEFVDLYDSSVYFKGQAQKLSDALYSALPMVTITELINIMTKRMYGLEKGEE